MTDDQIKNNSINFRLIVMALLLFLNGMLFFLYNSIPFSMPNTTDLSFTSKTLIEEILLENVKSGLSDGLLLLNLNSEPYTPETEILEWKKDNPIQIIFPEGKLRYFLNLFTIKTFNKNLEFNAKIIIDTMYPGSGSFGFKTIDNFDEYVFLKDNLANWYEGSIILEQFNNNENLWTPKNNTSYKFNFDDTSLFIENKFGIIREFMKISDNLFVIKSYSDKSKNKINFNYNSSNRIISISFNDFIYKIIRNNKDIITEIESNDDKIKFHYDEFNNLNSIVKSGNEIISIEHKSKTYPNKITSITYNNENIFLDYGLLGRIEQINSKQRNIKINYGEKVIQILSKDQKSIINTVNSNKIILNKNNEKFIFEYNNMRDIISYETNINMYKYEYSSNGNLIKKIINNDVFEFFYDESLGTLYKSSKNGDILFEKLLENGVIASEFRKGFGNIKYEYNENGQIKKVFIDSSGEYEIERDDNNLICKIIHPGKSFSSFKWENRKLVEYTDIFNKSIMFNYGRDGQLIEILHSQGKSNINKSEFLLPLKTLPYISLEKVNIPSIDYNNNSFQINTINDENIILYLDAFRRVKKVKSGKEFKNYFYDNNDLLSQIEFENNDIIFIETNNNGLTEKYLTNDGSYGQMTYDLENSKVNSIVMEKDYHSFKYDKKNNLTQQAVSGAIKYSYTYGPKDKIQIYQIEYPDKTTVNYVYDKNDKVSKITFNNRDVINFSYPRTNTLEIKYPNEIVQLEEYDDNNYLNTLSISDKTGVSIRECNFFFKEGNFIAGSDNGKRIQVSYTDNNNINTYFLQNVFDHEYKFSNDNEIIEIKNNENLFKKTFDPNSNIIIIEDSQKQLPITSMNLAGKIYHSNFSFLEINGIAQEEKSQNFTAKNHTITSGNNVINIKGFLANGSMIEQTINFNVHPDACSIYQLDNNGKLKYIHEDTKSNKFTWSSFNQLKSFTDKNGEVFEYQYYPNGLLASLTKQGKTTHYIYDIFGNLIEEIASTGRSNIKYVYDYTRDKLVMSYDGKNSLFYHTDAFGSVINITDIKGKNVAEYIYSPLGQVMYQKEQIQENRIGYLGMMKSQESGFYITKYGVYNPDTIHFYSSHYSSILKPRKTTDFFINKNIKPFKEKQIQSLKNNILHTPTIPYEISFNKEFIWMNFLDVPDDMLLLKNYLTHKEEN